MKVLLSLLARFWYWFTRNDPSIPGFLLICFLIALVIILLNFLGLTPPLLIGGC